MTAAGVWWNSRYLAYCRAMGTPDPHERRALDETRHPDAPFMLAIFWVNDRWREWERVNGRTPHGPLDHESFDAWLESEYPAVVEAGSQLGFPL